jgi:hypothetical protein
MENAGSGEFSENPSYIGNDATAGPTSETPPVHAETTSQGVEIAGKGEPSDKQTMKGSTASISSGDIFDLLGEKRKCKPLFH